MVTPLHSVKHAEAATGDSDPLDGLARSVQSGQAGENGMHLAKARVSSWLRGLVDILFPQAADQAYVSVGEVRDALHASAAKAAA